MEEVKHYVAMRKFPVKRGDDHVEVDIGEHIPEANDWPRLDQWVKACWVREATAEEVAALGLGKKPAKVEKVTRVAKKATKRKTSKKRTKRKTAKKTARRSEAASQ